MTSSYHSNGLPNIDKIVNIRNKNNNNGDIKMSANISNINASFDFISK